MHFVTLEGFILQGRRGFIILIVTL